MPLGIRIRIHLVSGNSWGTRLSRKLMRIPGIIHCLRHDSSRTLVDVSGSIQFPYIIANQSGGSVY